MSEEKTTKTPLTLNRGKLELKPSAGVQNRSGLVVEVRKKRVFIQVRCLKRRQNVTRLRHIS